MNLQVPATFNSSSHGLHPKGPVYSLKVGLCGPFGLKVSGAKIGTPDYRTLLPVPLLGGPFDLVGRVSKVGYGGL